VVASLLPAGGTQQARGRNRPVSPPTATSSMNTITGVATRTRTMAASFPLGPSGHKDDGHPAPLGTSGATAPVAFGTAANQCDLPQIGH
jgi:hypothetical protein